MYENSFQDVSSCDEISNHDAPFCIVNTRMDEFEPRHKFIRDEKKFELGSFIAELSRLARGKFMENRPS